MAVFGRQVGEWTAITDCQTRNSKAVLGVSDPIPDLRLPLAHQNEKDIRLDVLFRFGVKCAWRHVKLAAQVKLPFGQ